MDKIIYVGSLKKGDTSTARMLALRKLGYEVFAIDSNKYVATGLAGKVQYRLGIGTLIRKLNDEVLKVCRQTEALILWVDKGVYLKTETLKKIKASLPITLVHVNPDDPFGRVTAGWHIFKKAIPWYDVHFVSRRQNVAEYKSQGAKSVFEYDRSFSPSIHRPIEMDEADQLRFNCRVGFVGMYAKERADMILYLIQNGISVKIYGNGWKNSPHAHLLKDHLNSAVLDDDYAKAICGMDIALHFLRKENRDEQDSRTYEIPACGTFMLAERSAKHEAVFRENEECIFFDTQEELLQKVKYFMEHTEERERIALNGYRRSINSGYDHQSRLAQLLEIVQAQSFNNSVNSVTKHTA